MDYEVIKFENDNVELEVNVSPEEETVWLSKERCLYCSTEIDPLFLGISKTSMKKEN